MSLGPEEVAIRGAFARRDAAGVPAELWARLDRIPDEVKPLRPLPVRLGLAVAPWAAVIAAGLVLALWPRFLAAQQAQVAAPPGTTWSAADPGGGFADVGIFWLPWAWFLALLAASGTAWAVRKVLRGERPVPALIWGQGARRLPTRRQTIKWIAFWTAGSILGYMVLAVVGKGPMGQGDLIVQGPVTGAGPDVTVVTDDGLWYDETRSSEHNLVVDRYLYRVEPGQPFTYLTSVRNIGIVPITILGLPREPGTTTADAAAGRAFAWTGLALMLDPQVESTQPEDVIPFHPVTLAPGDDLTLLVAAVGGSCADPTAGVPPAVVTRPDGSAVVSAAPAIRLVYDVFGWRTIGIAYPRAHVTVPVRPGCVESEP